MVIGDWSLDIFNSVSLPPPSPKQSRIIWLALTGLALALIVGLIVALFWGMGQALSLLGPVLWPIAVAGVLAYLLDPVVDYLERKKIPRARDHYGFFLRGHAVGRAARQRGASTGF